ncbi:MAG: hypothetical protein M1834_005471 [Cirrosporium novae-zelandiae]|nr:MAG: hypothetical protein M1834_005471 [Cirrosporium novae-zelandiae]
MDPDKASENPFFHYTSGRWLWDEANQLRKRSQPFNIEMLKETAARSVNASSCISMAKLPEGSDNRVFLLTMGNGVQVVAKIPNPYLPQKVVIASEVVTLDFFRNVLNIPVPQVFAWSSNKDQAIGVEYIIMEKAPGKELRESWATMDISDRVDIVSQLASIQTKISSTDFRYYGSLYYRSETNAYLDIPGEPERFCIGPSSAIRFWEAERRSMDEYRGPCKQAREHDFSHSTNKLSRKIRVIAYLLRERHRKTRETMDKAINGPLLFDLPPATGLTAQEKKENLLRYQLTQLQRFYISKFQNLDNGVFRALSDPHALTRQQLVDFAGSTWEDDGLFLFREMMHRTRRDWEEITGRPRCECPVSFSPDELSSHTAEGKC